MAVKSPRCARARRLVVSSTNANREHIYIQQPPIAASGYSSQAFNPHYPHTERNVGNQDLRRLPPVGEERQQRHHGAAAAARHQFRQLRGLQRLGRHGGEHQRGSSDRMGRTAGGDRQLPAASYAYPEYYRAHEKHGRELAERAESCGRRSGACLQVRGEYLYAAEGARGMQVYDVASVANKGVSPEASSPRRWPLWVRTRAIAFQRRHLRGAADQSTDQSGAQHRRYDARRQRGAAVSSDLQLRVHHRCRERA